MNKKIIVIYSCKECSHLRYTESDYYCKMMPMSEETWKRIDDIFVIHESCPLPEYEIINKIEYKQIIKQSSCNLITLDELNKLGEEGWELVMRVGHGDSNGYIFKRIKESY